MVGMVDALLDGHPGIFGTLAVVHKDSFVFFGCGYLGG